MKYPILKTLKPLINESWEIFDHDGDHQYVNLGDKGWKIKLHNKKRQLGTCSPSKKTIFLSKAFLNANLDNFKLWNNIIRHEIAHAIDVEIRGTSDHSKKWKYIAKQVGADPRSTVKSNQYNQPESKYTLKCPSCGNEIRAHRKTKRSKSCGHCDPSGYNPDYKLKLIQNY